jgi:cation:H+ antiporter
MLNIVLLIVGVILLSVGGEVLIRGSLSAAKRSGVSPLLCGLVIIGFGTSAPELVVSIEAAVNNQPDIAVGNVVGSNIGNILLILGICALITPLTVRPLLLRRDALTVVMASLLFIVLVSGGTLGLQAAVILLLAFVLYLGWSYVSERFYAAPSAVLHEAEFEEILVTPKSWLWIALAIVAGLSLLIGGSKILLVGAVGLAQGLGVSEAAIGLTLVAVGTSLPELSISVLAALRRNADVAVGNVLGSNIFNLLGILGVSSLLQPLAINARILQFDQWVMLASSFILLLFLYTGYRLSRIEGGFLLICYIIYLALGFTFY